MSLPRLRTTTTAVMPLEVASSSDKCPPQLVLSGPKESWKALEVSVLIFEISRVAALCVKTLLKFRFKSFSLKSSRFIYGDGFTGESHIALTIKNGMFRQDLLKAVGFLHVKTLLTGPVPVSNIYRVNSKAQEIYIPTLEFLDLYGFTKADLPHLKPVFRFASGAVSIPNLRMGKILGGSRKW